MPCTSISEAASQMQCSFHWRFAAYLRHLAYILSSEVVFMTLLFVDRTSRIAIREQASIYSQHRWGKICITFSHRRTPSFVQRYLEKNMLSCVAYVRCAYALAVHGVYRWRTSPDGLKSLLSSLSNAQFFARGSKMTHPV